MPLQSIRLQCTVTKLCVYNYKLGMDLGFKGEANVIASLCYSNSFEVVVVDVFCQVPAAWGGGEGLHVPPVPHPSLYSDLLILLVVGKSDRSGISRIDELCCSRIPSWQCNQSD